MPVKLEKVLDEAYASFFRGTPLVGGVGDSLCLQKLKIVVSYPLVPLGPQVVNRLQEIVMLLLWVVNPPVMVADPFRLRL